MEVQVALATGYTFSNTSHQVCNENDTGVTLKSNPFWKFIIYHFWMIKADKGQILTLNVKPKIVENDPAINFGPAGGHGSLYKWNQPGHASSQ